MHILLDPILKEKTGSLKELNNDRKNHISHKILEKLGQGGMGVVYKAEDTKLKREVALKFLAVNALDTEDEKKRFLREAQAVAALNHSNIAHIYEIDEADGQTFIAMEYIEGKSIREMLVGAGHVQPLPLDDAINYATQIVAGLQAAHEKGIIHRDIKPANVLITEDNEVKIIDFGLARLSGQSRLTRSHTTLGTMAYMSPEQTRGEEVDHRTDIWSLGIVLYEMLTGELPFKGDYEQAVMYAILHEEPASIHADNPDYLKQVIGKALEKDQNQRYQKIQELLNDLESPATSSLTSTPREKSIIVLPFENISPDPEQEYFSDGLTEEIITDLSQIHDLLVISRNSAMTFKGKEKKTKEIAKEVNAQFVLEVSVRKAGNNLRITAQLIDAITDGHLWAEKYSGTLDDVFDIQEKVSRSIVDSLKVKLTQKEKKQIAERPIDNIQAYEYYLHAAREMQRFTEDGLKRALRDLKIGLEIVGENALLNKGMAEVYLYYYESGLKADEETLLNAEKYANKIVDMEPDSDASFYLLGRIERFRGSVLQALEYFRKAYAINPDNTDVLKFLCNAYGIPVGKTSLAEQLFKRLFVRLSI